MNRADFQNVECRSELELPNGCRLENRIVKAATEELLAGKSGDINQQLINLYRIWGSRGAGMIISGNMFVSREGICRAGNVFLQDSPDFKTRFKLLASAMKRNGSKAVIQINHAGRQSLRSSGVQPVAPSEVEVRGFGPMIKKPRALRSAEILAIKDDFIRAAQITESCGFDGVEIHAAHGYLLSQFLSPRTNHRQDEWGGSLENRARLLIEIVQGIRAHVSPGFILGVKLNSSDFQKGGFNQEDAKNVALALESCGIDFLEVSGGSYEKPVMMTRESTRAREAYFSEFSAELKKELSIPVLVTGGIRTADGANTAISNGDADLIGVARPFIVHEDFVPHMLAGIDPDNESWTDHIGWKWADNVLQNLWYKRQIKHTATQGKPIGPKANPYWALVTGLAGLVFGFG